MRIHVVGMGSVGVFVASHLKRALPTSSPVTLLHKTARHALNARHAGDGWLTIENQGVALTTYGLEHDVWDEDVSHKNLYPETPTPVGPDEEIGLYNTPHIQPPDRSIRSLVVTTKAYSVENTIQKLMPRLIPASTIVLLQNGMGLYDQLCDNLFPDPLSRPHFMIGVNNHGTWLKKHMHTVHAGIGSIKFSIMPDGLGRDFERSYNAATQDAKLNLDDIIPSSGDDVEGQRYYSLRYTLQAFLAAEGLRASWIPQHELYLSQLRKLVVNSVINPLTALLGCPNGKILEHEAGRIIAQQVCREASNVFYAQWNAERLAAGRGNNESFPTALHTTALYNEVERITRITSHNLSSMLTDIRLQRPTEIKYLNGYLVERGKRFNVATPTNRMLLGLISLRREIPLYGLL